MLLFARWSHRSISVFFLTPLGCVDSQIKFLSPISSNATLLMQSFFRPVALWIKHRSQCRCAVLSILAVIVLRAGRKTGLKYNRTQDHALQDGDQDREEPQPVLLNPHYPCLPTRVEELHVDPCALLVTVTCLAPRTRAFTASPPISRCRKSDSIFLGSRPDYSNSRRVTVPPLSKSSSSPGSVLSVTVDRLLAPRLKRRFC